MSYVRTVFGAMLQTNKLLGLPHVVAENTTLNESLDIHKNLKPTDNEEPNLSVLVIGNNGHTVVRVNNIDTFKPVPHLPVHAGLYGQIPFAVRRLDDDLPAEMRAKYRLRKLLSHTDGQMYVAYYGLVLDKSNIQPTISIRKTENGQTTVRPFVPLVEDLRPQKPVMETNTVLTTTGEYAFATAKVAVILSLEQVREIVNGCKILFGSEALAFITEVALCASVDRLVTGEIGGVQQNYMESIGTQICSFIPLEESLPSRSKELELYLDVGAVEPLTVLQRA